MPVTAILLFSLLLLHLAAWAQTAGPSNQGPPAAPVVTAPVEAGVVRPPLTLVGTAEPRYLATVASEGEGRVERLTARKGEKVTRGSPLVQLRTRPLELRLQEAEARLNEVEARLAQARSDAERAEQLFAQKFISEQELQARKTDLTSLQRQREQIAAEIRLLQDQLRRLEVRAPFAGRVVEERTEVGQWLGEGDPAVVLADLSEVHVMVPVPEQYIGDVEPGSEVEVRFDAFPGRDYSGRISAIIPQADPASRTFPVQISVKNSDGRLLAGMLARVSFLVGQPFEALLIPKDALVPQPGGGGHVVEVEDGRAAIVPVRVQGAYGAKYAVEPNGDLVPGDRVVVRGNERLRTGQSVREAGGGSP